MSSKSDTVVKDKTAMSTKKSDKKVEDPKRALYEYLKLLYSIKIKPKRLRFVTNSQCIGINFQQLRKLQDQTNLQELLLDMQYTGLVIELAVGLASKISKIDQLRKIKLDFTDCPIGSKGFQGVVVKLSRMSQLEDLALIFNQCKIESSAMIHLVERLKNLPQLKSLTLGLRQNQLDNSSLETIGKALGLCKQLQYASLDLSYNNKIINPKAGSLNLEMLSEMTKFELSTQASQINSADFVVLPPCLQELSLNLISTKKFDRMEVIKTLVQVSEQPFLKKLNLKIQSQPFKFKMNEAVEIAEEIQNDHAPEEPVEEEESEEDHDEAEEPVEGAEVLEEGVAEGEVIEEVAEVEPLVDIVEEEVKDDAEVEVPLIPAEVVPSIPAPPVVSSVSAEEKEKQRQQQIQNEREFNELADKVFQMNPLLEDLTLHLTFANEGIGKIAEKLSQLKNLKKLNLKNRFGASLIQSDVTKLCQFLSNSQELDSISLSFNHSQITALEVERIIQAVCSNNKRKHVKLNISNTAFLGNGPHTVIFEELTKLTSLESLSLNFSGNNLGATEGQILELAASLGKLSKLQSLKLNLRSNRILVEESEQISKKIGTLTSLSYLKLSFGVLTKVELNEEGEIVEKEIIDDQPIYKVVTNAVKQCASEITRIQLFDSYFKNFIPFNPYHLICDFYY